MDYSGFTDTNTVFPSHMVCVAVTRHDLSIVVTPAGSHGNDPHS